MSGRRSKSPGRRSEHHWSQPSSTCPARQSSTSPLAHRHDRDRLDDMQRPDGQNDDHRHGDRHRDVDRHRHNDRRRHNDRQRDNDRHRDDDRHRRNDRHRDDDRHRHNDRHRDDDRHTSASHRARPGSRSPAGQRHDRHQPSPHRARQGSRSPADQRHDRDNSSSHRARPGSRSPSHQRHSRHSSRPGSPGRRPDEALPRHRHADEHGSSSQSNWHLSSSGDARPTSSRAVPRSESRSHHQGPSPQRQQVGVTDTTREGSRHPGRRDRSSRARSPRARSPHNRLGHAGSTPHGASEQDRLSGDRPAHDRPAHNRSERSATQALQLPATSNRAAPSPILPEGLPGQTALPEQPLPPPPPQIPLQFPVQHPNDHPLPPPPPVPAAQPPSQSPAQPPASPDSALDFFSEHFDALRALYSKGLQPPVPKVKPMDNVTRCRMILPPELAESASAWAAAHPKIEPSQEALRIRELNKQRTAQVQKREQDQADKGNTLDKIAHKFTSGPLLLLRRYYRTSVRLQVATRHASGIRGLATGYLHGFDKFMNLVLMNVYEEYTVMVRVPHHYTVTVHAAQDPQPARHNAGDPLVVEQKQVEKFRWKRKAEKRNRNLRQVFLRGDNIVTIQPVLQDVLKNWAQLAQQWSAAGIAASAFPCPPMSGTGHRALQIGCP